MSTAAEDAKRYLAERDIPTLFESLMTGLMYNKPDDHVTFMASCLIRLKQSPPEKITWDLFVDNPPPIIDIGATSTTVVAVTNGHVPHPPPGNPPERGGSGRRRSGSGTRPRTGSKDRTKRAAAAVAVNGRATDQLSSRPQSRLDALEERLSTPLMREKDVKIPKDLVLILIFGGPGGARSQYSKRLSSHFADEKVIDVRMSDLVHRAFNKYHTHFPEWREAKAMYDRGELLPDQLSLALLKHELGSATGANYAILDGFPRTTSQIRDLEECGGNVKLAIILDFDEETLYEQTKRKGHGSAIVNRRLQEFKDKTLPVAKYYDDRYLLHLVPGEQDDNSIFEDLKTLINKLIKGELKPPTPTQFGGAARNGAEVPVLLVVGAPGSLKGDYCTQIAKRYDGFVHLSMGELIRKDLESDDPKWKTAKDSYAKGELIDGDMASDLIQKAVEATPGIWGFVIDGYPRDLAQARQFESRIGRVDLVLLIDCTEAFCLQNMEVRAGLEGPHRSDNTESAAKEKLNTFKEKTLPMLKYFDEKGKLKVVEGDRGVEEVIGEVYNILDTALFIPQDNGSGKSLS